MPMKLSAEAKKFQATLRPHKKLLLSSTMLAIDPSSISLGWAWFQQGEMMISGTYTAASSQPAHKRLVKLMDELQKWTGADVLVVEKMFRYNAPLIWSVGSTITTIKPGILIECPIRVWQSFADEDYVKSDEQDAILIGTTVIQLAKDLK
jgi:hypothetical protein